MSKDYVPQNQINKALREGRVAVGTNINVFDVRALPKLMEYANLDWSFIDMEHSGLGLDRVADMLAWFKSTPISVLVRPPDNMYHMLAGVMDAGAMGVFAPNVQNAAEARRVVDAVMYPPLGHRGVGLNGSHTDFKRPKAAEYMPARNAQTTIIALVETQEGLDNLEEIVAVEGISGVHPGGNDLTVRFGVPQQFQHPRYKDAVRMCCEAAARHGKQCVLLPTNDSDFDEFYSWGCRVMLTRAAGDLFQDALKANADHYREQEAKRVAAR